MSSHEIQPIPSEIESVRRELDLMRERYHEAERRVSEARHAAEEEEPWIWSDDDSAESVDTLGHTMVLRITGGHLRALLKAKAEQALAMLTAERDELARQLERHRE